MSRHVVCHDYRGIPTMYYQQFLHAYVLALQFLMVGKVNC